MSKVSVVCFLASYLVAFVLECVRLKRPGTWPRFGTILFGLAGLTAHTIFLWNRASEHDLPPLLGSSQDWLLVVAWVAVLFNFFLTLFEKEFAFGVFFLPLVLLLVVLAWTPLVGSEPLGIVNVRRGWEMIHAASLALGTAGILAAAVLALMYLVQHRRLRQKHGSTGAMGLPSLENLARLNRFAIIASVPLLTVGIVTGVILGFLVRESRPEFSFADPIVIGNIVVWLGMLVFLGWMLRSRRSAGRQVAWVTIWAFCFLVAAMIALQVLTRGDMKSWHAAQTAAPLSSVNSMNS